MNRARRHPAAPASPIALAPIIGMGRVALLVSVAGTVLAIALLARAVELHRPGSLLAGRLRLIHQLNHSADHIANVRKTAQLAAVIMHDQRPASDRRLDKSRQHHAVGPGLPRTDNVEKPADHHRNAEFMIKGERQELIDRFGNAVAPARLGRRAEDQIVLFAPRRLRVLAVNLTGAGDETGDEFASGSAATL